MSAAPEEQLMPTDAIESLWLIDVRNAFNVCPENVRPSGPEMVTETMIGYFSAGLIHDLSGGIETCFQIEGVKYSLEKEYVDSAFDECSYLAEVSVKQTVVGDCPHCRIVDIGTHGGSLVCRTDRSGYEYGPACGVFVFIGKPAQKSCGFGIDFLYQSLHAVIGH